MSTKSHDEIIESIAEQMASESDVVIRIRNPRFMRSTTGHEGEEDPSLMTQKNSSEIPFRDISETPNGFDSWNETHFEVVKFIAESMVVPLRGNSNSPVVDEVIRSSGYCALYDLAHEITKAFEILFEGTDWGMSDEDWSDVLGNFIRNELYPQ